MKKRHYIFDWDDNILNMTTKIKLQEYFEGVWETISVDTDEFALLRPNIDNVRYRLLSDPKQSFIDFRKNEQFLVDVDKSINNKSYGPSFSKFKECILYQNDFAIITARGHSPLYILKGIKLIIENLFTKEEKEFIKKHQTDKTLHKYLSRQGYYTVSSDSFEKKFKTSVGSEDPEQGKRIALIDYVESIVSDNDDVYEISVGFSDDDIGNIEVIEETINEHLKKLYPEIHFVIYDTSDPIDVKKRIIIIDK